MEIWRDVVGFEPYYEVSNYGKVRSKERAYHNKNGRLIIKHSKYLKPFGDDYLRVGLKLPNDTKVYKIFVHRIVAEAFIPNPLNKPTVNHLNGCKQDNVAWNLVWATYEEQIEHAVKSGLRDVDYVSQRISQANSKRVIATNVITGDTIEFKSISEAENMLGLGSGVGYYAIKHGNTVFNFKLRLKD